MSLPNYPNDVENYPINNPFTVGDKQFYWDGEKWKALSNADASLRSQLAAIDSSVLIGGVEAESIARLYNGIIDIRKFGAVGDGVTNDTSAIQAAIDYCQANNRQLVDLWGGDYLIDSLTVANNDAGVTIWPLSFKGAGWSKTRFIANSVVPAMFVLEGTLNDSSNYNEISDCYIVGNLKAQVGVYSEGAPHFRLSNVRGLNFTGFGLFYLQNSWSCIIENCRSSFNIGVNAHGARLGNTCFATQISNSFFFANDGWGLILDPSISIKVTGGIEGNKKGGLFASGVRGLDVQSVYFEGNGSVGDTLTAVNGTQPDRTVNCDILLNGASSFNGTYVSAFPCEAVNIQAVSSQITTADNTFIEVFAVNGLEVNNVTDVAPAGINKNLINFNIVRDNTNVSNVTVGKNRGFTSEYTWFMNEGQLRASSIANTVEIGRQFNLAGSPSDFVYLFNGASGNVPQVLTDLGYEYKGLPVQRLSIASGTESNLFGKIIDLDDPTNEWLRGQVIHVELIAKTYGNAQVKSLVWDLTSTDGIVKSNGTSSDDFVVSNNAAVRLPTTGTARLGFQLTNVSDTSADYADVILFSIAPLGVDVNKI